MRPEEFRERYAVLGVRPRGRARPALVLAHARATSRASSLGKVVVTPRKGTTLVDIALEGERPELLAPMLNLLIEVFSREQRSERQRQLDRQKDILDGPAPGDRRRPRQAGPRHASPRREEAVVGWTEAGTRSTRPRSSRRSRASARRSRRTTRSLRDASGRLASERAKIDALVPDRAAREDAARPAAKAAKASPAAADSAADEAVLKALADVQQRIGRHRAGLEARGGRAFARPAVRRRRPPRRRRPGQVARPLKAQGVGRRDRADAGRVRPRATRPCATRS